MIGILVIYFIGKAFYTLAGENNKSQWGFAVLGVFSFYFGTFAGGILIALIYEGFMAESVDDLSDISIELMALPVGLLSCWGLYMILKKQWSKSSKTITDPEVLDGDLPS